MKSISIVFLFALLSGCAGMDYQHQNNMTTNAGIWGIIGAATGAGIAVVTGGNPGKAAVLGGIGGAYLGAANTPPSSTRRHGYGYFYQQDCSAFPTQSEVDACEQGRAQRQMAIQRERERRAYKYGYYGY